MHNRARVGALGLKAAPMAEWLGPLFFSALNHSSSHHCMFEPSSGHVRRQVLLAGGQMVFLRDLPFLPHLVIDLAQNE